MWTVALGVIMGKEDSQLSMLLITPIVYKMTFISEEYYVNINLSFLIFKGEDVNRTLEGGRKPLHYAADCGQLEILEFLLLKGADINVS